MGFQYNKLFRKFELDMGYSPEGSTGRIYWEFRTERPGSAGQVVRALGFIDLAAGEFTRRPRLINLPGEARGRQFQIYLKPATTGDGVGKMYLYGIRVYAKVQFPHSKSTWQWYPIPMEGTSDVWTEMAVPGIDPTSKSWSEMAVPGIEPTSKLYTEMQLPIEPTSKGYDESRLPILTSPKNAPWYEIPVDQ